MLVALVTIVFLRTRLTNGTQEVGAGRERGLLRAIRAS